MVYICAWNVPYDGITNKFYYIGHSNLFRLGHPSYYKWKYMKVLLGSKNASSLITFLHVLVVFIVQHADVNTTMWIAMSRYVYSIQTWKNVNWTTFCFGGEIIQKHCMYIVFKIFLAYLGYIPMSLYNHDFMTIWDSDLGFGGVCGICVRSSWPEYWSHELYIAQYCTQSWA